MEQDLSQEEAKSLEHEIELLKRILVGKKIQLEALSLVNDFYAYLDSHEG